MIHWKISAICAAIAALLSILAGIFGGVSAGAVFYRAVVSGIVFGGLAVGTEILIRKFLPELLSPERDVDNDSEEVRPGSEVDIVVDDDESLVFSAAEEASGDEFGEQAETMEEIGQEEDEEPAEVLEDVSEDNVAVSDEAIPGATSGNGLPNIEEFSGSFSGTTIATGGLDSLSSGKARRLEAVDSIERDNDPATMAQAIRSIIHKDQEG